MCPVEPRCCRTPAAAQCGSRTPRSVRRQLGRGRQWDLIVCTAKPPDPPLLVGLVLGRSVGGCRRHVPVPLSLQGAVPRGPWRCGPRRSRDRTFPRASECHAERRVCVIPRRRCSGASTATSPPARAGTRTRRRWTSWRRTAPRSRSCTTGRSPRRGRSPTATTSASRRALPTRHATGARG